MPKIAKIRQLPGHFWKQPRWIKTQFGIWLLQLIAFHFLLPSTSWLIEALLILYIVGLMFGVFAFTSRLLTGEFLETLRQSDRADKQLIAAVQEFMGKLLLANGTPPVPGSAVKISKRDQRINQLLTERIPAPERDKLN